MAQIYNVVLNPFIIYYYNRKFHNKYTFTKIISSPYSSLELLQAELCSPKQPLIAVFCRPCPSCSEAEWAKETISSFYSNATSPYTYTHTHTHTHPFNGPWSGTTRVSRYQKGKTNLDFTEVRDSEWQWYQLGHMQVCTSLQIDNHTSTPLLSFLQAGCPFCRPTNSVKALKA